MRQWRFQHILRLFRCSFALTHVIVGDGKLVLDRQKAHGGINPGREGDLDGVLGPFDTDVHVLLNGLGNLLHIDHVLVQQAGPTGRRRRPWP